MDQSDINQLTAIFAKLGYDITITKKTDKESEPILPKNDSQKVGLNDDEEYKCVPIYMPEPINNKKCLCRLEKKGIPTQCSGNRLPNSKVCTRHNKKLNGLGFYDDGEPPERDSNGKCIQWKFDKKKEIVKKSKVESDSDEEEDKQVPVKKMTNSKHEELMKSLEESTDEEDVSSSDDDDEYNVYKKKDDLKLEEKTIDGVTYTYYSETNRLTNLKNEFVGTWNGKSVEWTSDKYENDHKYYPEYKS